MDLKLPDISGIDFSGVISFFGSIWDFIMANPILSIIIIALVLILGSWYGQLVANRMVTDQKLTKYTIMFVLIISGIIIFFAYNSGTLNFGDFFSKLVVK